MTNNELITFSALLFLCFLFSVPTYHWLRNHMPTKGISNLTAKKLAESMIMSAASTVFFTVPLIVVGISWVTPCIWFVIWTGVLYFTNKK